MATIVAIACTGKPSTVDVSLLNLGVWNLSFDVLAAQTLGGRPPRGDRAEMPNPLVNVYRTADQRFIYIVFLQSDRHWPELCDALERPDLLEDPRFNSAMARYENRKDCEDACEPAPLPHVLTDGALLPHALLLLSPIRRTPHG